MVNKIKKKNQMLIESLHILSNNNTPDHFSTSYIIFNPYVTLIYLIFFKMWYNKIFLMKYCLIKFYLQI